MIPLVFTKFLDVKSPLIGTEYSIGVDLYMPKIDLNFFKAFFKVNPKIVILKYISNNNICCFPISELLEKETKFQEIIDKYNFSLCDDGLQKICCFRNTLINENTQITKMITSKPITIPSGIGMDLSEGYYASILPKSGNLKNDYTVVEGTIDNDYTYGTGIQIIPLDGMSVTFEIDTRIAQIVLKKENKSLLQEISLDEFEKRYSVNHKRNYRKGGFGHTGLK